MRSVLESVNVFMLYVQMLFSHNFLASKLPHILQSRACRKHIICMLKKADPNSESKVAVLNIVKICQKRWKDGKVRCKRKKKK